MIMINNALLLSKILPDNASSFQFVCDKVANRANVITHFQRDVFEALLNTTYSDLFKEFVKQNRTTYDVKFDINRGKWYLVDAFNNEYLVYGFVGDLNALELVIFKEDDFESPTPTTGMRLYGFAAADAWLNLRNKLDTDEHNKIPEENKVIVSEAKMDYITTKIDNALPKYYIGDVRFVSVDVLVSKVKDDTTESVQYKDQLTVYLPKEGKHRVAYIAGSLFQITSFENLDSGETCIKLVNALDTSHTISLLGELMIVASEKMKGLNN